MRRLPVDPPRLRRRAQTLAGQVKIAHFLEASSAPQPGPYDVSLVEGSITTRQDEQRIRQVRESSKVLVTIGACATSGGIQALRNFGDVDEFRRAVYASPQYIDTLATSRRYPPTFQRIRAARRPDRQATTHRGDLCVPGREAAGHPGHKRPFRCKRRGLTCVMVADGTGSVRPRTLFGALCRRSVGAARLLRPDDRRKSASAERSASQLRHDRRRNRSRICNVQRHRVSSPGSRALTRQTRQLRVDSLARVEGEGALRVVIEEAPYRVPSCTSTNHRDSSRPSCAGGSTPNLPTSPHGSAVSVRSPI